MSISIRNIRKSFGDKEVLKGIDFDFDSGKVNMIIGASGSGKTVLTKTIVGLVKPDAGSVNYDGVDFLTAPGHVKRDIRRQIGMLFQSAALFDSMTVAQNVAFPLRMFTNWSPKQIRERVAFCLEKVNMPTAEKLFPAELSGGMKKRVGIARAIALNPRYLFCDEPNSGLDPQTAEVIDQLILGITKEFGTTTIVVSHDMKSVMTIGDKILFIYKGNKAWEGASRDIKNANDERLVSFVETSGVKI